MPCHNLKQRLGYDVEDNLGSDGNQTKYNDTLAKYECDYALANPVDGTGSGRIAKSKNYDMEFNELKQSKMQDYTQSKDGGIFWSEKDFRASDNVSIMTEEEVMF